MASKSSGLKHRFDHEIEKYRLELNWSKILDKLKTMKVSENAKFLEGEAKLELYLQQYPLIDERTIEHDDDHLNSIEVLLQKPSSFENACLLAKLNYIRKRDDVALSFIHSALNSIPGDAAEQPNRISLLLAEIYSLQGIIFEKQKKNLLEIIKSFDDSCKLSQIYYSAMENAKHLNNDNLDIENSLIEIAYQRLPLLHASNDYLGTAIEIFRSTIENYQIKSLETMRQTLIKQFAQLLIKCVCQANYPPIELTAEQSKHHHPHRRRHSESLFVPRNVDEEICLLLYLGENSTLNEAVLDWQPEYEKQRERSHQAAYHLLALLAIFLARKQAFHLIADSYEKALRFSFEHFQTWFNYGLSLISSGEGFRAYLVLKECIRMQPTNIQVHLLTVKVILQDIYDLSSIFETSTSSGEDARPTQKSPWNEDEQLFHLVHRNQIEQRPPFIQLIDEAIQFCEKARDLSSPSSARVLLLLGLAKSFKARQTSLHLERQNLFLDAIRQFKESIRLDPYDSLAHFHLAQNLSFVNEIGEAKESIEECLNLSPDEKNALHLYTLILTSEKQYAQAYQQIYRATSQYSDINLLLTKARLEEELYGYEQSIRTCKDALTVWKKQVQPIFNGAQTSLSHSSLGGNRSATGRSPHASLPQEIDGEGTNAAGTLRVDEGTTGNPATTATNTRSFLSHLRSLTNFFHDENVPQQRSSTSFFSLQPISFTLIQIFEYLVRYYIQLDQIGESEECLREISSLNPYSYQISHLRGFISDAKGQNKLAKQFYNDALSINPSHFPTLIQLTKLLIQCGNYSLAEKYARDAIAIQPSNYQPWYLLSLSMEARGEYQQSIDVAATAVHLEGHAPILPYESIIRVL